MKSALKQFRGIKTVFVKSLNKQFQSTVPLKRFHLNGYGVNESWTTTLECRLETMDVLTLASSRVSN